MPGATEIASGTQIGSVQQLERLPIINYIPPEGVEWRVHNGVAIPAQGASAIVVQRTIPKGYNAVLNFLANVFVGNGYQDFGGLITWQLFIDFANGIFAPNFQSITASLGSINNPAKLNGIRLKEFQKVTLQVQNANPGVLPAGQIVGGLMGGYDYPVELEPDAMTF